MSEDDRLGEVSDPDGRVVVLLAWIWDGKIARDHPELGGQLEQVLTTVSAPDHVEPIRARIVGATTDEASDPVTGCWWS